jgi:hypothetical protein
VAYILNLVMSAYLMNTTLVKSVVMWID